MKTALFSRPDMPAPDASKAAPEPSVATDPRTTSANSGAAFWISERVQCVLFIAFLVCLAPWIYRDAKAERDGEPESDRDAAV